MIALPASRLRLVLAIGAAMLLGLALRIAAARGALWPDEAWTAAVAQRAATLPRLLIAAERGPALLDSVWLQLAGPGAAPLLQRAPAIAAGTLAIGAAGLIGARQSAAAAFCAALLFAIAPALVAQGAAARGLAPMLLALLAAMLLAMRWRDDPARRVPETGLAAATLLGTAAHPAMLAGLAATILWAAATLVRAQPLATAARSLARLVLPMLAGLVLAAALLLAPAIAAGTSPHAALWPMPGLAALANSVGAVLLASAGGVVALGAALLLAIPRDQPEADPARARDKLLVLMLIAMPVLLALAGLADGRAPGALLLCGAGLLLLVAIRAGERLAPRHPLRLAAVALLALIAAKALLVDRALAGRGTHPDAAIDAMAARARAGTTVAVERADAEPALGMAAAARRYPLAVRAVPCPVARFLFVTRAGGQAFPDAPRVCGTHYRPVVAAHPAAFAGAHWTLYEAAR